MTRKKSSFILIALIFSILLSNFIQAQEVPPEFEQIQNVTEQLSEKETRNQYLKQEWTKILEKTIIGKIVLYISDLFKITSPVWKLLIGIPYTLSWLFFISLFIWVFIVFIIYKAIKEPFQFPWWASLGIAIIIPTLGAQTGIIQQIITTLSPSPIFKNKWTILIAIALFIVLLYLYNIFMKKWGKHFAAIIKKEQEALREQKAKTAEKIHDIEIKSSS